MVNNKILVGTIMDRKPNAVRGRPRTLDRDQILQTAVMEYWAKGPTNVSINDICNLTGASKPGVYREFESDDGLKVSALETYRRLAVQPLLDILEKDQPAVETVNDLIDFMTQDRTVSSIPNGCLLVMMRAQYQLLGPSTCHKLNEVRHDLLAAYAAWIERAKKRNEVTDIPTDTLAHYLDAQHGGAMRMQGEGVPNDVVADVLGIAFGNTVLASTNMRS